MFIERSLIALTTENNRAFVSEYISHIVNDGEADIYVNFDAPIAEHPIGRNPAKLQLTIKPGESINALPIKTRRIFYKSKSGEQPFRVVGLIARED